MSEATYAWRISRDVLFGKDDPDFPREEWSDAGVEGPSNASDALLAILRHPVVNADRVHEFRMLDDDRIVYYYGHITTVAGESPWDMDEDAAFGPLVDFGTPNAGAVILQYKNAEGEWETI